MGAVKKRVEEKKKRVGVYSGCIEEGRKRKGGGGQTVGKGGRGGGGGGGEIDRSH